MFRIELRLLECGVIIKPLPLLPSVAVIIFDVPLRSHDGLLYDLVDQHKKKVRRCEAM